MTKMNNEDADSPTIRTKKDQMSDLSESTGYGRKRAYRLNWMTFNKSRYIVDNFADCLNLRLYRDTLTMVHAHRNTLTYHIAYFNTRTRTRTRARTRQAHAHAHAHLHVHACNRTSKRGRVRESECWRGSARSRSS